MKIKNLVISIIGMLFLLSAIGFLLVVIGREPGNVQNSLSFDGVTRKTILPFCGFLVSGAISFYSFYYVINNKGKEEIIGNTP